MESLWLAVPLTSKKALHDVSPLELVATHVYIPESESWSAVENTCTYECKQTHAKSINTPSAMTPLIILSVKEPFDFTHRESSSSDRLHVIFLSLKH